MVYMSELAARDRLVVPFPDLFSDPDQAAFPDLFPERAQEKTR